MDIRLIFDGPASGDWNMAVDEALLESVGRAGQGGYLRFYHWKEATLSLGYFQRHADRDLHPPSRDCPLVRRSTGGGAIVHDLELTYSFVVPHGRHRDQDVAGLYFDFHETLIEELASRGIRSEFCGVARGTSGNREPFLCFLRRSEADVLCEGYKVAGSAQRRRKGAVLQHGSILLRTTKTSPELSGIEDLSGVAVDDRDLAGHWAARLGGRLNLRLTKTHLSDREEDAAKRWLADRFANDSWTRKR